MRKLILILAIVLLEPAKILAQDFSPQNNKPIKISRISSQITLDGLSNEAAWQSISSFPMRMIVPNYNDEPSERTEILMAYDDDYLYVAGRLYYKDPKKIRIVSFQRDYWFWNTDAMAILLDTYKDNENGVVFFTTPAGTRTDINILNDFKARNRSWNTFWDVASVIKDSVWYSEMRIPFSSLRYEEKNGQVIMGLTAHRMTVHNSETYMFPLIPQEYGVTMGAYRPSLTQEILFERIKSHKPFYIAPFLLTGFGQSHSLNESKNKYNKNNTFVREAGLDIKYGLSKNLTLDVTINPDFAQVEADDQQINLTRFSLFFPEKRLFFQERQGNFDFKFENNNKLFHSRRIGIESGKQVRIYGGARIVGRAGSWDIGFLNLQTEKFSTLPSENFTVMRLRKQVINPYSYIGGMAASRIGKGNIWNTTYGLDGIFRLFGNDYLSVKWAQSFENERENQVASLQPSKIFINWERRGIDSLSYVLSYSRSGEYFNPGIGFERRNNYTRFGDKIQYGWFAAKESWLHHHSTFIKGHTFLRNSDGNIESAEISIGWEFTTKTNTNAIFSINQYIEDISQPFSISENTNVLTGNYTFYGIKGEYSPLRGNAYRIKTVLEAGSFYDGRNITLNLKPTADISKYIQLTGLYQISQVKFPDRNQKFTGHIAQLKISTFLNSKFSLVSLAQYNSAVEKVFTNLRFRFNPKEGHDLYIVYNDDLNTKKNRKFPALPNSNNRTILLKYNYTFKIGL